MCDERWDEVRKPRKTVSESKKEEDEIEGREWAQVKKDACWMREHDQGDKEILQNRHRFESSQNHSGKEQVEVVQN